MKNEFTMMDLIAELNASEAKNDAVEMSEPQNEKTLTINQVVSELYMQQERRKEEENKSAKDSPKVNYLLELYMQQERNR